MSYILERTWKGNLDQSSKSRRWKSANGAYSTSLGRRQEERQRRVLYQPGAKPQDMNQQTERGLKARSIHMPQSLSLVIVHLIFSTKERRPFLNAEIRASMHSYLATVARNIGCECYRAGGVEDHVHLAIRLARTITIAELVEKLKTASSKWVKTQSADLDDFSWQRGYGCFSVGPKDLDALVDYIDRQQEHHEKRTFQEEFRILLNKYGVEFDEAYVWD